MPQSNELQHFAVEIAAAAQAVYDEWQQDDAGMDEVYGSGGICDTIADRIVEIIGEHFPHIEAYTSYDESSCHTSVVAAFDDGVFNVDIPSSTYEYGTAYTWTKRHNIVFAPDDIVVFKLDSAPENAFLYRPQ